MRCFPSEMHFLKLSETKLAEKGKGKMVLAHIDTALGYPNSGDLTFEVATSS